jgi:hypothetical protein
VAARYSGALLVCGRASSTPRRASPDVAPQMAATGTPASRNSRALSAAAACSPWSQVMEPGRISIALSSGVTSSSARSGRIVTPPIVRTGSRVAPTVRTT